METVNGENLIDNAENIREKTEKDGAAGFVIAVIVSVCLLFILLITAFESVTYWTPGFYEKEYTKHGVLAEMNREMTMETMLGVTDEMMQYLRGNREDLVVVAELDGIQQEFFNDREKAHMADVRGLFVGAIKLRRIAIGIVIAGILLLIIMKRKRAPRTLARGYKWACGITGILTVVLTCLISTDFNYVFIKFHHLFFDNDLWLLDPATDDMINMLPEGFFFDTAVRIGVTFIIAAGILLILSLIMGRRKKTKPGLV